MSKCWSSNESILLAAEQLVHLEKELDSQSITPSERRSLEHAVVELQQLIKSQSC